MTIQNLILQPNKLLTHKVNKYLSLFTDATGHVKQ